MEKKKYINSSNPRRVQVYLEPKVFMMFMAEKSCLIRENSVHARIIIEKYYSNMPESQQRHLLEIYNSKIKDIIKK